MVYTYLINITCASLNLYVPGNPICEISNGVGKFEKKNNYNGFCAVCFAV